MTLVVIWRYINVNEYIHEYCICSFHSLCDVSHVAKHVNRIIWVKERVKKKCKRQIRTRFENSVITYTASLLFPLYSTGINVNPHQTRKCSSIRSYTNMPFTSTHSLTQANLIFSPQSCNSSDFDTDGFPLDTLSAAAAVFKTTLNPNVAMLIIALTIFSHYCVV